MNGKPTFRLHYVHSRRVYLSLMMISARGSLALIALGGLISALVFTSTGKALATDYCTPQMPFAPYNGVCTGYGAYCTLGIACSPVPGTPGTRNPYGYTPMCNTSPARCAR